MKNILFGLAILPSLVTGGEFILHAAFDTAEKGTALQHQAYQVKVLPVRPKAYMAVRAYPADKRSHLLKFNEFKANGGFSFTASDAREIIWRIEGYDKLTVRTNTRCAFRIFAGKDCDGRFALYSRVNKKRRAVGLQIQRDSWQTVDLKLGLNGPFKAGDVISSLSLANAGSGKRNWKIDKFAIWSGEAPVPAPPVNGRVTPAGNGNKITWSAPSADFPVSLYRIYRGSVPNFKISDKTMIGETSDCSFIDENPMRNTDYYKIITVNIAGKTSIPSSALQLEK